MASKKRRFIPAEVREQLERKHKQAATMAERQAGALGKDARRQLKPLLQTSREEEAAPLSIESLSQSLRELSITFPMPQSIWTSPMWVNPFPSISFETTPPPPSVDPSKLEALRTAEPRKVEQRIPDMVEVVTGWRAWMLSSTGRLEALGRDTVWPVKSALVAECSASMAGRRHIAPAFDCSCGVWAFKDLDRLVAAIGNGYRGVCALGTVSLWGRVIETENGYRAQYAYPSELWLLDSSLEELGLIYDVPVRTAAT